MVYSLVGSPNSSLILGWMASSFFYFSFIFTLDSSSLSKTDTTTFAKLNKPPPSNVFEINKPPGGNIEENFKRNTELLKVDLNLGSDRRFNRIVVRLSRKLCSGPPHSSLCHPLSRTSEHHVKADNTRKPWFRACVVLLCPLTANLMS